MSANLDGVHSCPLCPFAGAMKHSPFVEMEIYEGEVYRVHTTCLRDAVKEKVEALNNTRKTGGAHRWPKSNERKPR